MPIEKVLIVDDEALLRNFLSETLRRKGIEVHTAENAQRAFNFLRTMTFDLVITDMKMPDHTGLDVLKKVKELSPQTLVVVVTAYGSIENAVEAMRLGAFNYLIKPFSPDTIEAIIDKALEHLSLLEENHYLRQQVSGGSGALTAPKVVGVSKAIQKIMQDVEHIAKSNASVFITGESGTGKEVIAQAIHYHSLRASRPFIKVNCAAIPDTLIETEFFGHEKGAFTGAHTRRIGRIELANTGTLLLDEITETPPMLQAKLLRVIQEQEFERVGGNKSIKVDVRFIATTNRNVQEAVEKKILREDLFYRLNVVPVHIPPLRERPEDIIPLAEYFTENMNKEYGTHKALSERAKAKLMNYNYPGNIRELANIMERAYVTVHGPSIDAEHLFISGASDTPIVGTNVDAQSSESNVNTVKMMPKSFVGMTLRDLEKELIIETLAECHNRKKAAEMLGISERTLRNRLHEYNLQSSENTPE